jgi:hypothetical protein
VPSNISSSFEYSNLSTQIEEQLEKREPSGRLTKLTQVPTTTPISGMSDIQPESVLIQFLPSAPKPDKTINDASKFDSNMYEETKAHLPEQHQLRGFPGQGLFYDDSKDPSHASGLLFRGRYECARLALANGLDPHSAIPQPASHFDAYDTLIDSLRASNSIRSKKMSSRLRNESLSKHGKLQREISPT